MTKAAERIENKRITELCDQLLIAIAEEAHKAAEEGTFIVNLFSITMGTVRYVLSKALLGAEYAVNQHDEATGK